jgi:hypothetical protein
MTVTQISAQDLFRAAYENRYTWDKSFPGYTADVTYKQGDKVFTGQIRIPATLKPEVIDIQDEEAKQAIHGQLFEVAIHRIRRTFEETHSSNTFSYGKTDEDGAVEILMGGKATGDKYKLNNNEVTLVHRQIHGVVVTIHTFSSHETGEGYLSHTYDSVYHDPKTGQQKGGKSDFVDEYEKVGNFVILNRRQITTDLGAETSVQEFIFSNIKLIEADA